MVSGTETPASAGCDPAWGAGGEQEGSESRRGGGGEEEEEEKEKEEEEDWTRRSQAQLGTGAAAAPGAERSTALPSAGPRRGPCPPGGPREDRGCWLHLHCLPGKS